MTDDRANIKVSREFYERHKERKGAGQTWEEYIAGQAPESGVDADELESIARSVATIEERTNSIENTLEGMQR